jgi:hypothetical protein
MLEHMAWVYIVECRDGSYYVGSTTDLDRRIWQHNEGLGAQYTRHRRPVRSSGARRTSGSTKPSRSRSSSSDGRGASDAP